MQSIRRTSALKAPAVLLAFFFLSVVAIAQAPPVNVAIDATKTGPPISKYIYGQFLEHGGDIVNTGIWAELLADRKFFYPVSATAPQPSQPIGNAAGNPRFRRPITRWWAPIGGGGLVTMDTKDPFTGDHTPLVQLDAKEPHGIGESGIVVRKGKAYTGRIVLAGKIGTVVKVTLIWGKEPGDRQTVPVHILGNSYSKVPLKFEAKADTDDARIEITGTGRGSFHIGAVSLMPADNIEGFRAEIIEVLKQLHSGVYRFPGGNFVSSYEWRYGVGDIDKRPPIFDPVWNAVQPNDVGTDEFLTLCRLLGVDAYITVNAGFGDAWSAKELVEYTNGAVVTPMGKWRSQRTPEAIQREAVGYWQRALGRLPDGLNLTRAVRYQTQSLRQGHEAGGPGDQAHRRRRHARRDGGRRSVQTHRRQVRSRLPDAGRLERLYAGARPGQHRHAQRALLRVRH
jgi:alpha-N-arabinofuranosidase